MDTRIKYIDREKKHWEVFEKCDCVKAILWPFYMIFNTQ